MGNERKEIMEGSPFLTCVNNRMVESLTEAGNIRSDQTFSSRDEAPKHCAFDLGHIDFDVPLELKVEMFIGN